MANSLGELRLRWALHATVTGHETAAERSRGIRAVAAARKARAFQIEAMNLRRSTTTTDGVVANDRVEMLRRRLLVVASQLPGGGSAGSLAADVLLRRLALAVRASGDMSYHWLLLTAVSTVLPTPEELKAFKRALEFSEENALPETVVAQAIAKLNASHGHYRTVRLVDGVVADVDFCAKHNYNSGIQRVVRGIMSRWKDVHECTPVAWTSFETSLRALSHHEVNRVHSWSDAHRKEKDIEPVRDGLEILIPWKATVFLPEIPSERVTGQLMCIGQYSGNDLQAIGYDLIPLLSGRYVNRAASAAFARYAEVLKYSSRILAISASVGEEFSGFADAVTAQNLGAPHVEVLPLPETGIQKEDGAAAAPEAPVRPLVLSIGSYEPRKNQVAILDAAEILWRKGIDFSLVLVGGGQLPWFTDVHDRFVSLATRGRSVSLMQAVSDAQLADVYTAARFSVFVSMHEGFGLPLVESFAAGVPVIHTAYGSIAEVGTGGGGVPVDPTDIEAIARAMEKLLTDDAHLEKLRSEIAGRSVRTWDVYAEDVWSLVTSQAKGVQA